MAFSNSIQFVLGQGGLNTPQPGTDYVSAMVFVSPTLPSGFSYSVAQELFSVQDAVAAGIVGNYSDETAASTKLSLSGTYSAGVSINITVVEPAINSTTNTVNIGTYVTTASDSSLSGFATNLTNFINTSFASSGYSGTSATASLNLVARSGLGTLLNGVSPTITITGSTFSYVSAVAFEGGINSKMIEFYYQISEFFRANQNGVLWVDFETSYGTFNCLNSVQNQANNYINQFAVYNSASSAPNQIKADCDAIQLVATTLFNAYAPGVVIYSPNLYSTTNLATLPNARTYTDNYVSIVIAQDGGNLGAHLAQMYAKSIPAYGYALGAVSSAKVSEDIGWVNKFNLSNGSELETVAFSNGNLYATLFSSNFNLLSQLDSYGYIFAMKRPNITGSFFNDSHSAISVTSDYAYIERNRTINKASRFVYLGLIPLVNGPLVLNNDGTLNINTIAQFKNAVSPSLNSMIQNGEISGYTFTVDPRQNVLETSVIQVVLNILPVGVAREIQVQLGFVTKL